MLLGRTRKTYPFAFSVAACFLKAIFSRVKCGVVKTWVSSPTGADDLNGLGVRGDGYGDGEDGVVGDVLWPCCVVTLL